MPARIASTLTAVRLAPMFVALGLAKHAVRVDRLARWAWQAPRHPPASPRERQRLVSLVLRLGAVAGRPDRDCLQRSLLIYRELSRAGAAPLLFVGFRRDRSRLRGHAWVECDGQPVTTEADRHIFEATWCFGPNGRVIEPPAARPVRAS